MSCQAPLCLTQPPQYRSRCGEGPRNQHNSRRFSYRPHGNAEGLYRVLYYQGASPSAVERLVLECDTRGVGGPLALRARKHDSVGFSVQSGKHTCDVLLLQDAEDDSQGTSSVSSTDPGKRSRDSRSVVSTVDNHGDATDLVYLKPSWEGFPDITRDLLLDLSGETLLHE